MLTESEFNNSQARFNYNGYADYMNQMNEMNTTQSDNTQDGNKFNFMDYLPFGSKSISGSIMRGIGSFMPDMDPRQKALNQFYDVNNGTIQSGLMKGYNPVSGGFLNTITGGRFGDPTNYGLQNAYQKRMDTINKTLQRKYTDKGLSFDNTELDERLKSLQDAKINESMMLDKVNENTAYKNELGNSYSGGQTTTNVGGQNITSYNDPFDPGGGEKDGGFIDGSNRRPFNSGGRAGYFFGGRVNYKIGGVVHPDGRKGFFKGAQADTSKGESMSPGTDASGGFRGGDNDGGASDNPPVTVVNNNPVDISTVTKSVGNYEIPVGLEALMADKGRLQAVLNADNILDKNLGAEFTYDNGPYQVGFNADMEGDKSLNANYTRNNSNYSFDLNDGGGQFKFTKTFANGGLAGLL